ncbi:hypothetical protein GTU73_03690 [Rathayibacter sp. VKM Ac-2804]|uniref:hypothetical protein n=1 Tax=unclassified Rathayibacter TaxID=2609250 RepID=UPI00132EDAD4|nr:MULTISPECIES: hypothetical protein [unclassified Rathayibacter]NRG40647.1 hypothetical protein [Rathayibacter sp. VKM Ac-2835]QHF23196.1 hypothetical protein GTU73_03690 [Rathayibacter sp. VKM Ac-2804]
MPALRLVLYLVDDPEQTPHLCTFHGDRHRLAHDLETRQFLPVVRGHGQYSVVAVNRIQRVEFERLEEDAADEPARRVGDLEKSAHTLRA